MYCFSVLANGKYLELSRPSFWLFKRIREANRRFDGELLVFEPLLINLQTIGHDLDEGLAEGMNY